MHLGGADLFYASSGVEAWRASPLDGVASCKGSESGCSLLTKTLRWPPVNRAPLCSVWDRPESASAYFLTAFPPVPATCPLGVLCVDVTPATTNGFKHYVRWMPSLGKLEMLSHQWLASSTPWKTVSYERQAFLCGLLSVKQPKRCFLKAEINQFQMY